MGEKKINKGRFKDEWMHLRSRPAGPIPKKTRTDEDDVLEEEDFMASDEPFFFEDDEDLV